MTLTIKKTHISVILGLIILLVLGFLAVDYSKAKTGGNSRIFKSKSNYKYPEEISFEDFRISVDSASKDPSQNDAKLDSIDCSKLPSSFQLLWNHRNQPGDKPSIDKYSERSACEEAKQNEQYPDITLQFKIKNISDSVSSLNPYHFSIAGDSSIHEIKRNIKSGDFVPGEERIQTIKFDYDIRYTGDYTLVVTKDNQKKYITFNYPLYD